MTTASGALVQLHIRATDIREKFLYCVILSVRRINLTPILLRRDFLALRTLDILTNQTSHNDHSLS